MEVSYGNLAVVLILEVLDSSVLFRFFLENGVPAVNPVKRLVKLVLLELAILPVLFCNLVLVPHLYVQDSCEQVGMAACCCLHNCIILEIVIFGFDTVTVGDVAIYVLDQSHLLGKEIEMSFHGRSVYLVPFVLRQEPVFMAETPEHDMFFPITFEHGSFVVLQKLPEVLFCPESLVESLV